MSGTAGTSVSAAAGGLGLGLRTDTVRAGQGRSSRVRPYAITRGRTRFGRVLLVETLVSALNRPADPADRSLPELAAICDVTRGQMRSIAEISALLRIPLGVVKVLVSDLADQGRVRVHGVDSAELPDGSDEVPGANRRVLLERVLGGLRKL
ncbi:DUF742 domain-containing protein [Kitasatospora azatica]|uniref:DUF742 domain-containing protein n=1 Tax=Kitasatospora azatica TaxID=58347 RepID=UPI000A007C8D|nr:DUF742 domain-containing protein [Kitasatospora azatica]